MNFATTGANKTIVRGDDYTQAVGSLTWESTDWVPLAGAAIVMTVRSLDRTMVGSLAGTVRSISGQTQTVAADLPHALTATWPTGIHNYDVQATLPTSGLIKTLVRGQLTVVEDFTI